jgi:5-methyltetrahydropteroyltriglutamate--homocysteine methyltransferase
MLLPTSVVGSHGLPGWVWLAREAMEAGRLGAVDVREVMEDATQAALLDQERAGVDVVTTGEMMRVRFIIGFYDLIQGIRALEPPRKLGQPLWDTNTPFEVVAKISAPHGLGIVDEFKLARSLTTRRIKATVPGPYTLLVPLKLGGGYKDKDTLLADLVQIVNAECRARRGRRRLHPDRRAAQRDVRGLGAAVRQGRQPGGRGRGRETRGPHLLRQPLRPAVQRGPRLPQRLPDAP